MANREPNPKGAPGERAAVYGLAVEGATYACSEQRLYSIFNTLSTASLP